MRTWKEIQEGRGLAVVDPIFHLGCTECGSDQRKLYTDQRLPTSQAEADKLRNRVWCKYHAIWFFKEEP